MLIRPLIDHLSRGWIPMAGLLLSSLIWATPLILDQFAWIADLYIHYQWAAQFDSSLHEGVWLPVGRH